MRYDQATTIVTFSDPLEAQVHRESAGAPISLRILRSLTDLNGWQILLVNDCLPVVLALRKGTQRGEVVASDGSRYVEGYHSRRADDWHVGSVHPKPVVSY
jgi:hypothetical protein